MGTKLDTGQRERCRVRGWRSFVGSHSSPGQRWSRINDGGPRLPTAICYVQYLAIKDTGSGGGGYISSLSRGEVDLLKKKKKRESFANFIYSCTRVQVCKYTRCYVYDLKFNYASIEETLRTAKDLISPSFNSIQYVPSASKYNPRQRFTPERIIPRGTHPFFRPLSTSS